MIEVKHDHKLQFPQIRVPMYNQDNDEGDQVINQTELEGVLVPLLRFNNTVITFEQVDRMELTCNPVPKIEVWITDFLQIIRQFDQPGRDNILYLQILPPFDDAYKKIQLAFYIEDTDLQGNKVYLRGTYEAPGIFDSEMKPYGMLSTYDLFEQVSNDHQLGFCSNVDDSEDERYIYNPNKNMESFLDQEIVFAGNKPHVFTWWIDFWNNLNFVDLYQEYSEILSDEDMQLWLSDTFKDASKPSEPYKQIAAFTNSPAFAASPTFIPNYQPILNSGSPTDANFEVYSMEDQEASSTVIQDGDVQNDVKMSYKYGGEVFGDFDYLSQRACRDMYLSKINSNVIEIVCKYPLLGLMKGEHVNFWWYDMNNIALEGVDASSINTNAPVPEDPNGELKNSDMTMILNKTVSGQYYIMDVKYAYVGHRNWEVTYTLSRSAEEIQKLAPPTNETFLK